MLLHGKKKRGGFTSYFEENKAKPCSVITRRREVNQNIQDLPRVRPLNQSINQIKKHSRISFSMFQIFFLCTFLSRGRELVSGKAGCDQGRANCGGKLEIRKNSENFLTIFYSCFFLSFFFVEKKWQITKTFYI